MGATNGWREHPEVAASCLRGAGEGKPVAAAPACVVIKEGVSAFHGRGQHDLDAPVLGASFDRGVAGNRLIFAVADR